MEREPDARTSTSGDGAMPPAATLAASLEREIAVSEDLAVFTLFAMLNVAGYDDENRESGMHPVRVQVRGAAQKRLDADFQEQLRHYYAAHQQDASPWSYLVVAKASAGPSSFTPTPAWSEDLAQHPQFLPLIDLHGLLRRFWSEAQVPSLYASRLPRGHPAVPRGGLRRDRRRAALLPAGPDRAHRLGRAQPPAGDPQPHGLLRAGLIVRPRRPIHQRGRPARAPRLQPARVHSRRHQSRLYSPSAEAMGDQLGALVNEGRRALGASASEWTSS